MHLALFIRIYIYTECPRRNVPDFGRVFLTLKRHATGSGKSETHTDSLVRTTGEEDFDLHKNVP